MTSTQQEQLVRERMFSLDTIADGAVLEAFEIELQKVLANITDPNTDALQAREITIKVILKPTGEDRDEVRIGIQCSSKLSNHTPIEATAWLQQVGSNVIATEIRRRQPTLRDYGSPD